MATTKAGKPLMRGMSMREMKARVMRNQDALASGRREVELRARREHERPPESAGNDDELGLGEGEALAVEDDGTCRVRRGSHRNSDEDGVGELPSEPPPGWGMGDDAFD